MASPPVVVGLTICRDFLRDAVSGNYSVIRSFTGHPVDSFPGTGEPFCVFAILTDGTGTVETDLVITQFTDDGLSNYARLRGRVSFPDPLRLVECTFRFRETPSPDPGIYLFTLLLDGEWAAQRSLRVYQRESS